MRVHRTCRLGNGSKNTIAARPASTLSGCPKRSHWCSSLTQRRVVLGILFHAHDLCVDHRHRHLDHISCSCADTAVRVPAKEGQKATRRTSSRGARSLWMCVRNCRATERQRFASELRPSRAQRSAAPQRPASSTTRANVDGVAETRPFAIMLSIEAARCRIAG